MTTTNDSSTSAPAGSGPAFPMPGLTGLPTGEFIYGEHGMSLRVYAAIALRVPDSGLGWLDDMIRAARRDEFAAKVMQGMCAHPDTWSLPAHGVVSQAYALADLMLKAGA